MNRLLWLLPLLTLAGCEQTRPPTAEGLKLIKARTATGTVNTKLETKTQPDPPRAGEVTIWDLKVFDIKDKPDGNRKEWKFFNALPQSASDKSTTEVLMNAWLISRDNSVFLPQKPRYLAYGSFLTNWTIPTGGDYTLWVEYQPVRGNDRLSVSDLQSSEKLPFEYARWNVKVGGSGNAPPLVPQMKPGESGELRLAAFSLDTKTYGAASPFEVLVSSPAFRAGQLTSLGVRVLGKASGVSDQSLAALSPDGKTLLHLVGSDLRVSFPSKGKWRAWFSFSLDGKPYAAPVDFQVK